MLVKVASGRDITSLYSTGAVTFDDPRIAALTVQVRYLGRTFEDDLNTLPIGSTAATWSAAQASTRSVPLA